MSADLPIACTLTAAELPKRVAEMRTIGKDALISAETRDARATLHFRPDPERDTRLREIVAAEAECCAFLQFDISHESAGLVLTIEAPDGGEPMMRGLVEAFRGTVARPQ